MKKVLLFIMAAVLVSCTKQKKDNYEVSDETRTFLEQRFTSCHLKDSLGDDQVTQLWSEYKSGYNGILCFQYHGKAIEYFYHDNRDGTRIDTFIIKQGDPFVDDLRDTYRKLTDKEYIRKANRNKKGDEIINGEFLDGFGEYFKSIYPREEDFIESMIEETINGE